MPSVPTHLRTCFGQLTNLPEGDWSPAVVAEVVANLRRSEITRTRCGTELLRFYEGVRAAYSE